MAVHQAGQRLFRSIPFKHLAAGAKTGGGRATNVALNLTPFVDMMTILVTFLLMVFSSSGDLLIAQKGLELPDATSTDTLQLAPVIIITPDQITFKGKLMASVDSVARDDSPTWKIEALHEALTAAKEQYKQDDQAGKLGKAEKEHCEAAARNERLPPGQLCRDGLAILQADKTISAKVINRVVNTAKGAGFDNLLFATKSQGK